MLILRRVYCHYRVLQARVLLLTRNHATRMRALMWTFDAVNNVSTANRDYMEFKGTRFIDIKDIPLSFTRAR